MTPVPPSRGRRGAIRHGIPIATVLSAFTLAAVLLPSALRPPPDPSNTSSALNPNAPPDDSTQIIESLQQAGGGGAGSGQVGAVTTTSTTMPPTGDAGTTTTVRRASLSFCYGNPPRQIPSVYSGPCVGAWQGENGGKTSKNVFPNEIRIGFQGSGKPPAGRLPEPSTNTSSTSSATIAWQVLQEYVNKRFQLYGRRVVFYGVDDPASTNDTDAETTATKAVEEYQLFAVESTIVSFCKAFARKRQPVLCDPVSRREMAAQQPYLMSGWMDIDLILELGAEYVCKTLAGRDTRYGGPDVNGRPRKYGFLGYLGGKGGIQAEVFQQIIKKECGLDVVVATLNSESDATGASQATSRFRAEEVTTIIFHNQGVNVLLAMQQADNLAYTPEWVILGEYAVDTNLIGAVLPPNQTRHMFGITSGPEWPQDPDETECVQAVRTISPGLSPGGNCGKWLFIVLMASGVQGAGPNLTPESFRQALFAMGHRYGLSPWMRGGGFGPSDYAYTDDVGTVWWSATAPNINDGAPGAYVWTHGGRRFQRGQLPPGEDPELFTGGSSVAPSGGGG